MEALPDELWKKILEMGIENTKLSYKDLCCLSITSKQLNRISNDNSLWINLLTLDFPQTSGDANTAASSSQTLQSSYKSVYELRFERDKERKLAAHRRAVLRVESEVAVCSINLKQLERKLLDERERMKKAVEELDSLEKTRQASVALNVWQPEIVRGQQKQLVQQCALPVESRISAVEMELRLCKQQIAVFNKAYRNEKHRLDAAKERLCFMKYHPLREHQFLEKQVNKRQKMRKKLKQCVGTVKDPWERPGDMVSPATSSTGQHIDEKFRHPNCQAD